MHMFIQVVSFFFSLSHPYFVFCISTSIFVFLYFFSVTVYIVKMSAFRLYPLSLLSLLFYIFVLLGGYLLHLCVHLSCIPLSLHFSLYVYIFLGIKHYIYCINMYIYVVFYNFTSLSLSFISLVTFSFVFEYSFAFVLIVFKTLLSILFILSYITYIFFF